MNEDDHIGTIKKNVNISELEEEVHLNQTGMLSYFYILDAEKSF